jgi:hypothetical protein
MKTLDDYFKLRNEIFTYFGYAEDWRVLPLDDGRDYYWYLEGEGPGSVHFADSEAELDSQDGNYYVNEIYTQRHLPKWVYRGEEYTLVVVDTRTDGNQFLQVFSNANERKRPNSDSTTVKH